MLFDVLYLFILPSMRAKTDIFTTHISIILFFAISIGVYRLCILCALTLLLQFLNYLIDHLQLG